MLVVCAAFCALAVGRVDAQSYSIVDLGTLGGNRSGAYGISQTGTVVGYAENDKGNRRPILWRAGVPTDLGTLGGTRGHGLDITDAGEVVGFSYVRRRNRPHAFLWKDGLMSDLGTLGGKTSYAIGVNNQGQIVGRSKRAGKKAHAFLWENGVMIDLGTLTRGESEAGAINEAGQVVGRAYNRGTEYRPFLWQDGVMIDLGTLGGDDGAATDINERGQVVGRAETEEGEMHGFIWEEGVMRDLGIPTSPCGHVSPAAINNHGLVVGEVGTVAFLWRDGVWVWLIDLIPEGCGWKKLWDANDINDAGQIVGWGVLPDETRHAYLMTPYACEDVLRIRVRYNARQTLVAKVKTLLAPGTVLHASIDGEDERAIFIDGRGKGKARWKKRSGEHEVCIVECPSVCGKTRVP